MEQTNSLYSEDLAPVPQNKRTWNTWNYAALWISMSLCIPTYMLASSLIGGGMNWWEAILTIFLGNSIVLIPMMLNGHAAAPMLDARRDTTRRIRSRAEARADSADGMQRHRAAARRCVALSAQGWVQRV